MLIFFFLFVVPYKSTFGQNNYRYEIGLQNDNDAYLMTLQDRYYTNGIDLYFKKAADSTKLSKKLENKIWSFNIGHKIYNAHTGSVDLKSQIDRPLTGYLYTSGEIKWFFKNEEVFSFGSEIAMIGPKAYGKDVQKSYHRVFGFYDIKGWEYQLNNAIGIDIRTNYSRLIFRNKTKKWDSFLNAKLSLGLNNTRVSIGPGFRYGRFNPVFESMAMGGRINSKNIKPKNEAYIFYRPQIDWVIYNSTIQGGMLIKNKGPVTYGVKPIVLSQVIGIQWNLDRIGFNFNYTFNTKEVRSEATRHQFGSLSVAYYLKK